MSVFSGLFPTFRDVRLGFRDSRRLLALRRQVSGRDSRRVFIMLMIAAYSMFLLMASNAGSFLVLVALRDGVNTEFGALAVAYLSGVQSEDLSNTVYLAFNSVVLISLLAPLAGAANIPYFTQDEVSSVGVNRLHRFFDGFVTQFLSLTSFLQLLFLVLISSLATINGGRVAALGFGLLLWLLLVSVTVLEGWFVELLIRTVSFKLRMFLAGGLSVILGLLLWADPNHGRTLFGLGNAYNGMLNGAVKADVESLIVGFSIVLVMILVVLFTAVTVCHVALSKPVPVLKRAGGLRSLKLSSNVNVALLQLLVGNMWRIGEVRRPVLTVLLLTAPTAFFTARNMDMLTGLIIAVPLAVVLSWGVNLFGILGPAMMWLRTLPHVGAGLLRAGIVAQCVVVGFVTFVCWFVPFLTGRMSFDLLLSVVFGSVAINSVLAYQSAARAVKQPHMVRLSARGDSIVPPTVLLEYTAKFTFTAGLAGVVVFYQQDWVFQAALVAGLLIFGVLQYWRVEKQWCDPQVQSKVSVTVSNI